MTQTATPSGATPGHTRSDHVGSGRSSGNGSAWASGGAMFAGVLLLVDGVLALLNGVAAIAKDNVYARVNHYTYMFTLTSWGWVHVVIGAVLVLVGLGVLTGALWARLLGIGIAAISVVANFIWLPYQPVWAIISVAIGIFVIWSLFTERTRSSI